MSRAPSESSIPGDIYLCQVSETVSCAACCGLYNAPDSSFTALQKMLSERTRRFARLPRKAQDMIEFGRQVESRQVRNRPLIDFHHCPFIGLIGGHRQRVGCLLHPLADGNKGIDYRGLSYYGGMACRQYFCPSHRQLAPEVKLIVRRLAGNWYEYGLIVTETALLGTLASEIEKRLSASMSLGSVADSDNLAVCRALRELFYVKTSWPYRKENGKGPCHYLYSDRRYAREPVDYDAAGRRPVEFETIFNELTSTFRTADDLRSAERRLEAILQQASSAIRGSLL